MCSISSHFVLWDAVSQTKYCCSPKIKISPHKKEILSWLRYWVLAVKLLCPAVLSPIMMKNISTLFWFYHKQQKLESTHHENFLYVHQRFHYCCPLRLNYCSAGVDWPIAGATSSLPDPCFCFSSYDMSSSVHQSRIGAIHPVNLGRDFSNIF